MLMCRAVVRPKLIPLVELMTLLVLAHYGVAANVNIWSYELVN